LPFTDRWTCGAAAVAVPTAGLSWRRLTDRRAGALRGCEVGDAALRGCNEDCSIISPRWMFWTIGRPPNHGKPLRRECGSLPRFVRRD